MEKENPPILLKGKHTDKVPMENSMKISQNVKNRATTFLGIYPNNIKTLIWKEICPYMFTRAIVKNSQTMGTM